jgi:hypothetical protein
MCGVTVARTRMAVRRLPARPRFPVQPPDIALTLLTPPPPVRPQTLTATL